MTILIQGAMKEEIDYLIDFYKTAKNVTIAGYEFYLAQYKGHKVVISLTNIGIINSTTATAIAIMNFSPDLVINEGCAGSHILDGQVGDIVIGESSVYINNFVTKTKSKDEGSNSLDWTQNLKRSYSVSSTPKYVNLAKTIKTSYNLIVGKLGSGDLFSRECDRILYLHNLFGELCEDMESIASLKVCESFSIDRIAFRIISNNELISAKFDRSVCKHLQIFVVDFIEEVINSINTGS